jgi:hypothetical protein
MKAPAERQTFSDALFNQLGQPKEIPISVAMQEVQARYWLDERFVVRSLDGRVDPVLLNHATNDSVDHIAYLRERNVRYLLDTPSYNRDPAPWSLRRLNKLQPGDSSTREGVTFLRLPNYQPVQPKVENGGAGDWRWFADADGAAVLRFFMQQPIRIDYGGPG